jgi:hypothetical protein
MQSASDDQTSEFTKLFSAMGSRAIEALVELAKPMTGPEREHLADALGFAVVDHPELPQIAWRNADGTARGRRPALETEVRMWRFITGDDLETGRVKPGPRGAGSVTTE